MTGTSDLSGQTSSGKAPEHIIISVDAMGGDKGPATVVAGISRSAKDIPGIGFILHGPRATLEPLVARRKPLQGRCEIRDAEGVVSMDDKPGEIMRSSKSTSMWSALESVRSGEARVCVSCGNTGALMLLSVMRLRKLPGVYRPAIAVLWPSRNPQEFNVMLDAGADVKADERDLLQYALMGASYARNGLGLDRPRVGLLNVGTEDFKGRTEMRAAKDLIAENAAQAKFDFVGFVEGSDLTGTRADVIVTMGCGDVCPVYPATRFEDWELTDPAGQDLTMVRGVRDEIHERVLALMASLDVPVG